MCSSPSAQKSRSLMQDTSGNHACPSLPACPLRRPTHCIRSCCRSPSDRINRSFSSCAAAASRPAALPSAAAAAAALPALRPLRKLSICRRVLMTHLRVQGRPCVGQQGLRKCINQVQHAGMSCAPVSLAELPAACICLSTARMFRTLAAPMVQTLRSSQLLTCGGLTAPAGSG